MSEDPTNKRSIIAFTQYFEGEQKFDYFITSVAGVLCAFIAERYEPIPFGPNAETVELIAILFLILSFFFGLKRIEWLVVARQLNAKYLDHIEKSNFLGNVPPIMEPRYQLDIETGNQICSDPKKRAERHRKKATALRKKTTYVKNKAKSAYSKRSCYLMLGLFFLLLAKVVEAYAS